MNPEAPQPNPNELIFDPNHQPHPDFTPKPQIVIDSTDKPVFGNSQFTETTQSTDENDNNLVTDTDTDTDTDDDPMDYLNKQIEKRRMDLLAEGYSAEEVKKMTLDYYRK